MDIYIFLAYLSGVENSHDKYLYIYVYDQWVDMAQNASSLPPFKIKEYFLTQCINKKQKITFLVNLRPSLFVPDQLKTFQLKVFSCQNNIYTFICLLDTQ